MNLTPTTKKLFYSYTSISKPAASIAMTRGYKRWSPGTNPIPSILLRSRSRKSFTLRRRDLSSPLSCRPKRSLAFRPSTYVPDRLRRLRELRDTSIHRLCNLSHGAGVSVCCSGPAWRLRTWRAVASAPASARIVRILSMISWRRPSGSYPNGRSVSGRIAIGGGSNAGLLVGAAITQRPDLFRAAICLGPLLDMTRYHLFDFAAGWADEYGSPEDEQDFRSLLAYSPYHRVQDGWPIRQCCSFREMRTLDAIRCMPAKWRRVCKLPTVPILPFCSTTKPRGVTHQFSHFRRRSKPSPTDSLSSATNSEFMFSQGGLVILFFQALFLLFVYDALSTVCRFQTIYSMVKRWKVDEQNC